MMKNSNVNREVLVDGFEAYEAVLDTPTYVNRDIAYGSIGQAMEAYNESREEVCY